METVELTWGEREEEMVEGGARAFTHALTRVKYTARGEVYSTQYTR